MGERPPSGFSTSAWFLVSGEVARTRNIYSFQTGFGAAAPVFAFVPENRCAVRVNHVFPAVRAKFIACIEKNGRCSEECLSTVVWVLFEVSDTQEN